MLVRHNPDVNTGVGAGLHWTCLLLFQLMDMSEKLWQVYNRLDPVSLDSVFTEVTGICSCQLLRMT